MVLHEDVLVIGAAVTPAVDGVCGAYFAARHEQPSLLQFDDLHRRFIVIFSFHFCIFYRVIIILLFTLILWIHGVKRIYTQKARPCPSAGQKRAFRFLASIAPLSLILSHLQSVGGGNSAAHSPREGYTRNCYPGLFRCLYVSER